MLVFVCIKCTSVGLCRCAFVAEVQQLGCVGAHRLCISRVVYWVVSVRISCVSVGLCIGLCRCASVVHQLICALGCVGAHRLCQCALVVHWSGCALGCASAHRLCISWVVHWVVSVRIGCASVGLCIGLCRCAFVAEVQQLGCVGAHRSCISRVVH